MKKYFAFGFVAAIILVAILLFFTSRFIKSEQEKLISTALHDDNQTHLEVEIFHFDELNYKFLQPALRRNIEETKKNVHFINFWATWCAPCVQELPELKKLMDQNRQIEFVFCSEENPSKTAAFLKKKNLSDLPTVQFESSNLPMYFDHKSIPCTYIIDNDAKIMIRINGVTNWDSKTMNNLLLSLTK